MVSNNVIKPEWYYVGFIIHQIHIVKEIIISTRASTECIGLQYSFSAMIEMDLMPNRLHLANVIRSRW